MRALSIILIASLGFAGCLSNPAKDRERAALHMQIGTGYLASAQYPQAMSELLKAEQLDPTNPNILNNLGLAFYVRGRTKQAEEKFRAAIKVRSDFSDAKNNLARVLIDEERLPEAIRVLSEVEGDLTYKFPEKTLSNLGMAYFLQGNFKKSEDALARSLQIRRESCTTAHYYGRALFELKRVQQSAEMLDHAVEFCRASKFEDPLFFSAMSYFSLGEKEKSRARLEELLKDYPKSKYVAKAKGMLQLLEQ
jgi:type IV pilus assembly protein PilF